MSVHIREPRGGFRKGLTWITRLDETDHNTGIGMGVLKLKSGESYNWKPDNETALLLMQGTIRVKTNGISTAGSRDSLFNEEPTCIHISANSELEIDAERETELTVYQTENKAPFDQRHYIPGSIDVADRGKEQAGGTCWRIVRTILGVDGHAGHVRDPDSQLVIGETITLPGRWSSYPPHHHSQPEVYHYRFNKPQGFGHAEHGEDVYKVRNQDTLKILSGEDHAQVAAPGYAMYYSWVIRHLPDNPYTEPEFTEEHTWMMDGTEKIWHPS